MTLTLIEKEHLLDNVWAFRFKPSEPLNYTAGQFVRVELPHDNPDKEGTKRWFTDSAAPYQGILQITTRVTDSTFKQALSKLDRAAPNCSSSKTRTATSYGKILASPWYLSPAASALRRFTAS